MEANVLEKLVSVALSLLILFQAYAVKRRSGTWITPACLYGISWFVFTIIPLLSVFTAPVNPVVLFYILATCVVFSSSGYFWNWPAYLSQNRAKTIDGVRPYDTRFLFIVFLLSTVGASICWLGNSIVQGIPLTDIASNLLGSAASYAAIRNRAEVIPNFFLHAANVLTYIGVCLGGFAFRANTRTANKIAIAVLSFAPSAFVMVTQSNKGTLFLALSMFYGAVLVSRLHDDDRRLLDEGWVKYALISFAVVVPLVTAAFMSRGLQDLEDSEFVSFKLTSMIASYSSGHLYAFGDWLCSTLDLGATQTYAKEDSLTLGLFSFLAIFRLLGNEKSLPPGLYDEYFQYGDILESNIYTVHRGTILDFGFFGSFVYVFVVGLVCHWMFRCILSNRMPTASAGGFVVMMGYFYTSFLASLFMWNSVYATFLLLWLLLSLNWRFARGGRLARVQRDAS